MMKPHRSPGRRRAQQGVVLYVALVVMIAMMLAGVAMLRSVGTGVAVAGNLSFKQNATLAGDRGAEGAVPWLLSKTAVDLYNSDAANGYSANWASTFNAAKTDAEDLANPFDPVNNFDWSNAAVKTMPDDGSGNQVRYVIHRLCKLVGSSSGQLGQECAVQGDIGGTVDASGQSATRPPRVLYRVTTRIDGPRNSLSYVQVVVY